jgi:hypothetical protein
MAGDFLAVLPAEFAVLGGKGACIGALVPLEAPDADGQDSQDREP